MFIIRVQRFENSMLHVMWAPSKEGAVNGTLFGGSKTFLFVKIEVNVCS